MCVVEPEVAQPTYIKDGVLRLVPTPEARAYLETLLPAAAARLREASGLDVVLVPEDGASAVLEAPKAAEDGWYGSFRNGTLSLAIDTIQALAVEPSGIVLHEVMHGHGASHVGLGEGIMSPELAGNEPITTADLESLCNRAPCTAFNPERP